MTLSVTQSGTAPAGQVGPLLFAKSVVTGIPATGDTGILEVMTLGLRHIGVYFEVATNNLDTFIVSAKFHPDAAFVSLYTGITSTPAGLIIAASGTLATTAAAGSGWFLMDVRGIYAIKISVSGTVADTTAVNIYASGSR